MFQPSLTLVIQPLDFRGFNSTEIPVEPAVGFLGEACSLAETPELLRKSCTKTRRLGQPKFTSTTADSWLFVRVVAAVDSQRRSYPVRRGHPANLSILREHKASFSSWNNAQGSPSLAKLKLRIVLLDGLLLFFFFFLFLLLEFSDFV